MESAVSPQDAITSARLNVSRISSYKYQSLESFRLIGTRRMGSFFEYFHTRIQQRWVVAVMTALALLNALTMRLCLSVAITAMVKPANKTSNGSISNHDTCPSSEFTSKSSSNGGTYEWDEYTQGVILSSFFVGYIITQIPGGLLAQKFGGKYTMGFGVLSTAVLTLLTPATVDNYGSTGLIVLRFVMGLLEGPVVPAASVLISKWAPADERTKIGTTVMSGMTAGTVVGNALSGVLIHHSSIGWPIVFYVFGTLSILWFFAWIFLCFSHPDVHPFISDMEKKYLRETTEEDTSRRKRSIPWRHIATSVPFWALLGGKTGFVWGSNTLSADLPKYMNDVLKFSVQSNGLLSALPYMIKVIVSMMASWFSDWLIKTNKMSRTNVRKTLATIASALSAVFLLAASYAGCDRTLVVIYFTVAVGMMAFFIPGIMVNINDLSPNYAGTIMSVANMVGCVTGILAPYVAGIITTNQALSEWRMVFWINFVIAIFSSLIFLLWADGDVQYWNDIASPVENQQEIKLGEEVSFLPNLQKLDAP